MHESNISSKAKADCTQACISAERDNDTGVRPTRDTAEHASDEQFQDGLGETAKEMLVLPNCEKIDVLPRLSLQKYKS